MPLIVEEKGGVVRVLGVVTAYLILKIPTGHSSSSVHEQSLSRPLRMTIGVVPQNEQVGKENETAHRRNPVGIEIGKACPALEGVQLPQLIAFRVELTAPTIGLVPDLEVIIEAPDILPRNMRDFFRHWEKD